MPWDEPTIPVDAPIAQRDPTDNYPSHLANSGRGGHHTAATLELRDDIASNLLAVGMTCAVAEDGVTYKLTSLSPVTWSPETTSGINMNTGRLLGRTSPGSGSTEEITPSADFDLAAGSLSISSAITDDIDDITALVLDLLDGGFDGGTWA